ncbi:MAG: class I SAM-dependent methyltransferase [Chloroflexi bacterium]|nr:class I SAM-dependent methyltransferase [Chloroflexota bacterium]
MQSVPDWIDFWRDLVDLNDRWLEKDETQEDHWRKSARKFAEAVRKRWQKPDSIRDFFLARVSEKKGASLLDVGAGTGAWSLLAAKCGLRVTAVDPSAAMLEVMREEMAAEGIVEGEDGIQIVHGYWPEVAAQVEQHDFTLCAHAIYGVREISPFIDQLNEKTLKTCFMLVIAPEMDALMAEFARRVLGHPFDSPDFPVLYNLLIQKGIYANVLFSNEGLWDGWTSKSLEDALQDVKQRLGLKQNPEYDDYIYSRLKEELTFDGENYVWPRGIRTAMVYWDRPAAN